MSEHSITHIEQARFSFGLIKWLSIVSLLLLPFSFSDGIADWRFLVIAPLAGMVWFGSLVYSWRRESILGSGMAFLVVIGAYHFSNDVYSTEPPFGHFLQWLAALLLVAATPLVAFRDRLLRYCRLQKPESTTSRS